MSRNELEISEAELVRGNNLVTRFAELSAMERDRYLLQATELLELGVLEISRGDCKFKYQIHDGVISFHVLRIYNNTSASAEMPIPVDSEAKIKKLISAFAQSEAVARN